MSNPDRFSHGIKKAIERRAKQQQVVDKADDNSDVITTNVTAKKLSDEQYKQTMVQNMIALIHKRKTK